ncbi:MAG: 4-hydroxy-tetrahydrodipicolinate synthase [Candidatus Firestonebacteria bacterium]
MFKGSIVALVTPFKNGKVNEKKINELVEFHIKNKTSGIIPCGTTGESPTLSYEEHRRVIEIVVKAVRGKIPVMAGTGSNSTEEALELTKFAENAGVDGVLLVSPYYNKPTQKGLYLHFKKIAESVNIPMILYNIPGRCGVNIEPETMAKLSQIKNIIGVKEASGSLDQVSKIIGLCGDNFDVLSGDDSLTLAMMAVGAKGVISVIANIVPKETADMVDSFLKGNLKKARELHYKLLPIMKIMFIETSPIPIKTAMNLAGMDVGELRLPLCEMEENNLKKLQEVLKKYNLMK